jgi:uncharacterized membrane-anchored protein
MCKFGFVLILSFVFAPAAPAQEPELNWQIGPIVAPIGSNVAEISLSTDYVYLDAQGTHKFLELTENPVSGDEIATVSAATDEEAWFLIFEYNPVGYVKDDEADELNADEMLAAIRRGTEEANKERQRRGWGTLTVVGWHEPPHYDPRTNLLTWAIVGESAEGRTINRNVRLLGRRGYMTATLVTSPEELAAASGQVDRLLRSYRFVQGNRYAEFMPGKDKVADIGLKALVVGGAAAVAVKSGLLLRFWKLIAAGVVALLAGLRGLFRRRRA